MSKLLKTFWAKVAALFTNDYMFGQAFPGFHLSDKIFFGLSIILLASAIIIKIAARNNNNPVKAELYKKLFVNLMSAGCLALLWSGLRYELIYILSMHLFIVLIYLAWLVWLIMILKYWRTDYKIKLNQYNKQRLIQKYL